MNVKEQRLTIICSNLSDLLSYPGGITIGARSVCHVYNDGRITIWVTHGPCLSKVSCSLKCCTHGRAGTGFRSDPDWEWNVNFVLSSSIVCIFLLAHLYICWIHLQFRQCHKVTP